MRVALTFDAEHPSRANCPTGAAEGVLDVLQHRGVQATFFVQGRWATAYPALARRIADDGHLIGSHSHYHARLPLLTDDGVRADAVAAEQAIEEVTGASPKPWFRAPYGDVDDRVLGLLQALGYRHVGWDVIVGEWDPAMSPAAVEEAVCSGGRDGAVVVLHTWAGPVVEALPGILDRLDGVVRLDELD